MRSKRLGRVISALCALAAVAARDAAAQAPKDPCTLLTPSQVAGALGVKDVGGGVAIGKTGCSWQAQGARGVVTLSFWDPHGFTAMKAPLPNVTKSSVSGVGDDAVYANVGGFTSLSVKQSGSVFIVKVYGVPNEGKQKDIEKTLARDVIAKL